MLQIGPMQVETALLFESLEQIYARVFRALSPRTRVSKITVEFRDHANANSRAVLRDAHLRVRITDLLETAPAPVQEALAHILIGKLLRRKPSAEIIAIYNRYLNRADVRHRLDVVKRQRGRKLLLHPRGENYDLQQIFDHLNQKYFAGSIARPQLGWSARPSRTSLGHYDPSHRTIALNRLLDSRKADTMVVEFVMFHEILHLKFGMDYKAGQARVHTKEFKAAEKSFERYAEARTALKRFLEGL